MKNPLNYQSSEYDCGPVTVINGIRYLFDREEVYPDLVKEVMHYCMDSYNDKSEPCKCGTSAACMRYMADWLTCFGKTHQFPLGCCVISGESCVLEKGGPILTALENGSAIVLRLYLDVPHYVLLTGIEGDQVLLFDPYYEEPDEPDFDQEYLVDGIAFIEDQPKKANRKVSIDRLNSTGNGYYEMGCYEDRLAMLMFRPQIPLT